MLSHLLRRAPQGVLARGLKTLSPSPPASKRVVPLTAQTYPSMTRSPSYARLQPAHLEYFASVLGADRVLTDSELVETYNTDWTRKYKGQSSCVLRPSTTEEVASILAYCHREGIAVVPQAGNTGVVGGSVPVFDEVILSVSLMNQVKAFDDVSGIITCQAGCILENLDKYCSDRGFMMPLDLGSKGTCQIGGNLGSNAGGQRLMRYGSLHGSVLSLQVVIANGRVLDLGKPLRKDNTGYDLKHLFIGSEGTLGVITEASILTPPKPNAIQVAILGLGSFEKVLETFKSAKHHLGEILSAFEVFDKRSLEIVLKHTPGSRHPLGDSTPFYILIESAGSCKEHDDEKLTTFLESVMESGLVTDGVVAQDGSQAATFWALRESISDSCAAEGGKYKYDVSVPLTSFYPLVEEVSEFLVSKGLYDPTDPGKGAIRHVIGFGHMGDGNVHLNVLGNGKRSTETEKTLNDFVFRAVSRRDGSISAEHGIGLQKAHALSYSKSSDAIDLMRVFKATLDPRGILNPYKTILPSKEKT